MSNWRSPPKSRSHLSRVYLEYLAAGGVLLPVDDGPRSSEIAELLAKSSVWAWLADEPDIYLLNCVLVT